MCHGLPCIGAQVTLLRDYQPRRGQLIPRNSMGEVVEEYLETRQVDVYFFQFDLTVRLPESAVAGMPNPEPQRGPVSSGA